MISKLKITSKNDISEYFLLFTKIKYYFPHYLIHFNLTQKMSKCLIRRKTIDKIGQI